MAEIMGEYAQAQTSVGRDNFGSAPIGGGLAVFAGVGHSNSRAVAVGLGQTVTADDIDQIEQFFSLRGAPSQVDLCPFSHQTLLETLRTRRYGVREFCNIFIHSGNNVPEDAISVPGLEVKSVSDSDLTEWAFTVAQGLGDCDEPTEETVAFVVPMTVHQQGVYFLATLDGQPVAGAAMSVRNGVAGLFGSTVRRGFRRRGIQRVLLAKRVSAARMAGCDLIFREVDPGSDSERNGQRVGFELAYSKVTVLHDQ